MKERAMPAESPVSPSATLMIAWLRYAASTEFANAKRWAVAGGKYAHSSLWAAFEQGFLAAGGVALVEERDWVVTGELIPAIERLRIKAENANRPAGNAAQEERECGTCGRTTLPDGDCYGCEADRMLVEVEHAETTAGQMFRLKEAEREIRERFEAENAKLREVLSALTEAADGLATGLPSGPRQRWQSAVREAVAKAREVLGRDVLGDEQKEQR
jgi:hypothetical protein